METATKGLGFWGFGSSRWILGEYWTAYRHS